MMQHPALLSRIEPRFGVPRQILARMGGAERYPSIAFIEMMGFAGSTHPESFIGASQLPLMRKTDGVDNKTGSSDLPVGQYVDRAVESHLQKYSCFRTPQITSMTLAIPSHKRGVSRSSRTRDGMRWTRQRFARDGIARKACERSTACGREMLQRTAKSCGPDAPTLASSSRS
jgi:hypothetical protein